jgi:hypothetical protein
VIIYFAPALRGVHKTEFNQFHARTLFFTALYGCFW